MCLYKKKTNPHLKLYSVQLHTECTLISYFFPPFIQMWLTNVAGYGDMDTDRYSIKVVMQNLSKKNYECTGGLVNTTL